MNATQRARSLKFQPLESLDDRITPSGGLAVHPAVAFAPAHVPAPVAAVAPTHAVQPPTPIAHTLASGPVAASAPTYKPDGTPMDKLGQTLNVIYQEYAAYVQAGSQGTFTSSQASKVFFQTPAGGQAQVEVSIQVPLSFFNQALVDTSKLGMTVVASDGAHGVITGYIPISQLPQAANDADFTSLTPVFKPPTQVPFRFGH